MLLPKLFIIGYVIYSLGVLIVTDLEVITVFSVILLMFMVVLPDRKLKTGIIPILLFLSATFFSNLFFIPGKIVFVAGPVSVTEEGFSLASLRALRVFLLIAGAKFISIFSSLDAIICAMGQLLSPLEKAGVPVERFFKTMSLSVGMLPVIKERLTDEYSRRIGVSNKRGFREKTSVVFRFILPVFFESIHNPQSFLNKGQTQYAEGDEARQR